MHLCSYAVPFTLPCIIAYTYNGTYGTLHSYDHDVLCWHWFPGIENRHGIESTSSCFYFAVASSAPLGKMVDNHSSFGFPIRCVAHVYDAYRDQLRDPLWYITVKHPSHSVINMNRRTLSQLLTDSEDSTNVVQRHIFTSTRMIIGTVKKRFTIINITRYAQIIDPGPLARQ